MNSMYNLTLFGVKLTHRVKIVSRFSGEFQRWEFHNLIIENLTNREVANLHSLISNSTKVHSVDALQFYNNQAITDIPLPITQSPLLRGGLNVNIEFPVNISANHVTGFAGRFFTFRGHKKLYLLTDLGVDEGARTGKMKFVPNAQAEVETGDTINFVNPQMMIGLADGRSPPIIKHSKDNFTVPVGFLVELWNIA